MRHTLLIALKLLPMVVAVVAVLLAIWLDDARWGATGAVLAVVGIPGLALFMVDDMGAY